MGIQAREQLHQRLIEEGVVTQEQLDEFEQWMESRPEMPGLFGPLSSGWSPDRRCRDYSVRVTKTAGNGSATYSAASVYSLIDLVVVSVAGARRMLRQNKSSGI